MSKAAEHTATPTTTSEPETQAEANAPEEVSLMDHIAKGAGDLVVQHLHGLTVGLTHFLAERDQAHAEGKADSFETLKTLNAAHKKYKAHTHDTTNTFVEHVMKHKKTTAKQTKHSK